MHFAWTNFWRRQSKTNEFCRSSENTVHDFHQILKPSYCKLKKNKIFWLLAFYKSGIFENAKNGHQLNTEAKQNDSTHSDLSVEIKD